MKILKYPTLLLFFAILFFTTAKAATYDATLSLGNLCEYIGKIQTDESGGTNVCNFNPYIAGSYDYILNKRWALSPEIGFSIPQSGRDENINKMSFTLLANAKYKFEMAHFFAGAGFFITRISGAGGTQELNNGNGTVSFPMPETTTYARNFIVNLGLGADFNREWSADLHTYIFNLIKTEDRAFSVAINGTYHFGEL